MEEAVLTYYSLMDMILNDVLWHVYLPFSKFQIHSTWIWVVLKVVNHGRGFYECILSCWKLQAHNYWHKWLASRWNPKPHVPGSSKYWQDFPLLALIHKLVLWWLNTLIFLSKMINLQWCIHIRMRQYCDTLLWWIITAVRCYDASLFWCTKHVMPECCNVCIWELLWHEDMDLCLLLL